jgi:hypothetical protein
MLRTILIIVWLVALGFFVWEFVNARKLPTMYGKASPNAFRIADVLFGAAVLLTLYYLITDL